MTKKLKENIQGIKSVLSAQDILVYEFQAGDGTDCAIVYTDGMTNKQLLGDLAARPLASLVPSDEKTGFTLDEIKGALLFPELKEETEPEKFLRRCSTETVFSSWTESIRD